MWFFSNFFDLNFNFFLLLELNKNIIFCNIFIIFFFFENVFFLFINYKVLLLTDFFPIPDKGEAKFFRSLLISLYYLFK